MKPTKNLNTLNRRYSRLGVTVTKTVVTTPRCRRLLLLQMQDGVLSRRQATSESSPMPEGVLHAEGRESEEDEQIVSVNDKQRTQVHP